MQYMQSVFLSHQYKECPARIIVYNFDKGKGSYTSYKVILDDRLEKIVNGCDSAMGTIDYLLAITTCMQ